MSAREWPDDALEAMHQAMFEDAFDGANLPLLGAGADAFATALAAAGYRILAPGEMDRETIFRCAEEVIKMIPTIPHDGPSTAMQEIEYSTLGYALMAIRALGGGEG